MKRILSKPEVLIPLLIIIGFSLFLSQAQAETVKRTVTRTPSADTQTVNEAESSKGELIKAPEYELQKDKIGSLTDYFKSKECCQMQKCDLLWKTLFSFKELYEDSQTINAPNPNSIHVGISGGNAYNMTCVGLPMNVYFDYIQPKYSECALANNYQGKEFTVQPQCKNPSVLKEQALSQDQWLFYIFVGTPEVMTLNLYIQQEHYPNTNQAIQFFKWQEEIFVVCVGDGVQLLDWAKDCQNDCCKE